MRRIVPIVVGALGLLVARPAGAYTGCRPDTATTSKCEGAVAKAFAKLTGLPAGALNVPNDLEYGLLDVMASTGSIPAGRLFTVAFQSCQAAPALQASGLTCRVKDATDSLGLSVDGITCTVTVP